LVTTILEARGLSRSFAGFMAVDGVDLKIREGGIHALIGPNGAGKTTCFNLLTSFLKPSAGRILFTGRDITGVKPDVVARSGLVRSFQISAVFSQLSVHENVRLAVQRHRGHSFDWWRSDKVLHAHDERASELLEEVGLGAYAQHMAGELSYGRKRALELATTLALEPRMLLLDEPMAGMGAEDIAQATQLIRKAAQGRTVLMVEHNLSVVSQLCDRITVLARGKVIAEGDYAAVAADERVVEAYLGRSKHKKRSEGEKGEPTHA
jgi:branched-chain amino acid transport system ATP-binding protein